ncbi:MAG: hypothetical protein IT373_36870 [Polyangiaceae bacterium]|nr:hypothetical protein [Polyangiaceae bacterium]
MPRPSFASLVLLVVAGAAGAACTARAPAVAPECRDELGPVGEPLPPPFTAEQLRAAMPAGRVDRYLAVPAARTSAVMGPRFVEVTVVAAADDRYELASVEREVPGWVHGEATIAVRPPPALSWLEVTGHALFDGARSRVVERPCDTALGTLDCLVYSVREGELVLAKYYAKSLPGPPVMVVKTVCRELVELLVLVAHHDP